MRILVTGAYGLIGSAIVARLRQDGHLVVGAGRSLATARRQHPDIAWVAADFATLTTAERWRPLLAGVDAVVNCAGAFQRGARDDLRTVHVDAPRALFAACAAFGPRRVIQISAIGAAAEGPSEFATSKGEADSALAASDLDWLILRPGVVIATGVYGATAMLRGLAGLPFAIPLFAPDCAVQIVSVGDVAATVSWALEAQPPARAILDLVHPQTLSLKHIVTAQRRWLGFRPAPILALPGFAARLLGLLADGLGWLGWRSPVRSTAAAQLTAGIVGDPTRWAEATGLIPRSYDEILALRPATLQDRWFARLYFLKPLAIAVLALFWVGTGLIALGPGRAAGQSHLLAAGLSPAIASAIVIGGAWLDILLGLALLVRRATRAVLIGMLIATPGYLLAGTILAPHLWADPVGAFTKVFPLLLATAFTLAILDER
jgi:uncharacterized protein YbjT (DUF2867 family)